MAGMNYIHYFAGRLYHDATSTEAQLRADDGGTMTLTATVVVGFFSGVAISYLSYRFADWFLSRHRHDCV